VVAVRTLVVTLSPLLRELVTSVLPPQISVDVVEALATREHLAERIREIAPDLVLLGLGEGEGDGTALPLLAVRPLARILVLTRDGASAWLYESPGRRVTLSVLSVASLKEALRASLAAHSD
jgi:DNA-binding NarL/FixJ family response regulator